MRPIDKYTVRAMSSASIPFVPRCSHSMKSFVCLHLSGAPYLLNSSYIRQLTRLYLVTEIRILRQINTKIGSEGSELNQCIKIQFLFRFSLFTQCVFLRVSSLITRPIFLNSRFIHLTWCPCGLVTEIRILRQIN